MSNIILKKQNGALRNPMVQIADMEENFNLPEAVLARCPTCLANFRKNFCDLTCRPDQSRFVNASKTVKAEDFKGESDCDHLF